MRCLVTGGAGFIGSAVVRALLEDGSEVRALDNLSTGFEENVPPGADLIRGDLSDIDALTELCEDIEVIFHEAAVRSVPRSLDVPAVTNEANVTGTLNLLVAAERMGVRRLVYASSSSIYGDVSEGLNTEDATPSPRSPYAVSKLAGEHYCRVWSRLGRLPTVSLRYFNVFGPGQHPGSEYAAVFPAFVSSLAAGRPPEVHWDGEQSRDFTYIDDVVRANLLAARSGERTDGAVINIGGGRPKTVNEVLESIAKAMDRWIEPVHAPKRPGDVRQSRADINRARRLLGWSPQGKWEDAVRATVGWFADRMGRTRTRLG